MAEKKATTNRARSTGRDLMTAREIATESGLGMVTVYDYMNRGVLPSFRVGRWRYVTRLAYQQWLASLSARPSAA